MKEIASQSTAMLNRLRDIGWTLWDPIGLLPPEGEWDDCANRSFAGEYDQYLIAAADMEFSSCCTLNSVHAVPGYRQFGA